MCGRSRQHGATGRAGGETRARRRGQQADVSVDGRRAAAELDSRGAGGPRPGAVPAAASHAALDSPPLSASTQGCRPFHGPARAPLGRRRFPLRKTGSGKEHARLPACVFWAPWGGLGGRCGRNERGLTQRRPLCCRLRTGVSAGRSPGRRPEPHRGPPARKDAGWCRRGRARTRPPAPPHPRTSLCPQVTGCGGPSEPLPPTRGSPRGDH